MIDVGKQRMYESTRSQVERGYYRVGDDFTDAR